MTDAHQKTAAAIKAALSTSGYSMSAVAQKIGSTYDRLSNAANGRSAASPELIERLREFLELADDWPESALDSGRLPGTRISLAGTKMREIRVVGDVAAGEGLRNVDVESRSVFVPEFLAKAGTIGFVVDGDSMVPMLEHLDIAVFKQASRARDGYVFLIRTENGDRCKVTVYDRGEWYLVSVNPAHGREKMTTDDQVLGMLIGYVRVHGTAEQTYFDPEGMRPERDF